MIYNWHTKITILTPPKTASSSLHEALCTHHGYLYILATTGWDRVSKHCSLGELGTDPPEYTFGDDQTIASKTFLCVRHPAERIVSMYRHHVSYSRFKRDFEAWVRGIEQAGSAGANWLRSCHAHLAGRPCDGIIRTEHLNDDLVRLGLPPIHARINAATSPDSVDRDFAAKVSRNWWPDDWQYYEDAA